MYTCTSGYSLTAEKVEKDVLRIERSATGSPLIEKLQFQMM
jgi:hypothetical protein